MVWELPGREHGAVDPAARAKRSATRCRGNLYHRSRYPTCKTHIAAYGSRNTDHYGRETMLRSHSASGARDGRRLLGLHRAILVARAGQRANWCAGSADGRDSGRSGEVSRMDTRGKTIRALSVRQAANCEEAKEPVCRCRCGGALHGAKRNGAVTADLGWLSMLPDDDPHHVDTPEQKKARKHAARQALENKRMEAFAEHNRQMAEFYREQAAKGIWI